VFGVVAAQAALREREITGKGQRVSSALFESAAFLMGTHMGGLAATGLPAMPMPARRGAWAIYEVFTTADGGQLFIGVTSDQQWVRFTEAFGLRDLATDPRLRTNAMRGQERSWLIPTLKEILGRLPQQEVMRLCEGANISWAPVGQPADLFSDAHLLASGGLLDVLVPRLGASEGQKVGLPALPVEFGMARERPGLRRQPPRLGEHNEEVLREFGLASLEIAALAEERVIVSS
jgi:crotonobetainyl-CoA:carnitine CoA-transferase CaiB-like acyl-CoA transferase